MVLRVQDQGLVGGMANVDEALVRDICWKSNCQWARNSGDPDGISHPFSAMLHYICILLSAAVASH